MKVAGVVAAAITLVAAGSAAIATVESDPPADRPRVAPLEVTPAPEPPGPLELGTPASEPIPVVTPSPPGPVPMPHVEPVRPGPVPMPHVQLSSPDSTLLLPPRR